MELYKKHGLLQIHELININISTHIHNIDNNYIHSKTNLTTNNDVHNYNTRNSNQVRTLLSHTSRNGTNALFNKSIRTYNSIPEPIRMLPKQQFKAEIKKYFSSIMTGNNRIE